VIEADVPFCEDHVSVTFPPPAGRVAGEAVNVPVGAEGAVPLTETAPLYAVVPAGPTRVSLNVVEEVTFTVVEPDSGTAPTPGETDADVAFCEDQVSVTVPPPNGSVAGEAVNVPVGPGGAGAVTETDVLYSVVPD
jgi:hypothetical protein